MADDVYGLTGDAARKLAADHRRLAQMPQGGDGAPYHVWGEGQDWIYFRYPEFKQEGGSAGASIAPGYPTALESGASNPGSGYIYWYNFRGDHRNVGLTFVRQDTYGDPWARVKRTGLYWFGLTLYGQYDAFLSMSGQTGVTGAASAGTAHTHNISDFYDTTRCRTAFLQIDMQKRVGISGAWGNVDYWRLQEMLLGNIVFSGSSDFQLISYSNAVRLQAGWDIRLKAQIVRQYPSGTNKNLFTLDRAYSNMLVRYLGPCESAFRNTSSYMESP